MNRDNIERVLVIRQHDQLGDFLLSTPVLQALRNRFPSAHIGVLVRDSFSDVVIGNPFVDEILVLPKQAGQWDAGRLRELFRRLVGKWDLAVVLNTVSHSLTSDLLARLSGARLIAGSEHRPFTGTSQNVFYNLRSPYARLFRHQTERNLDIVRYFGADTQDLSETMFLAPLERQAAARLLDRLGIDRRRRIVALHIGAGKLKNRWPVDSFARLARLFHTKLKAQVLVCWGDAEENLASEFSARAGFRPFMLPPGGIRSLAAAFLECDLLVCNDTGVLHVGAASGVPVVAVFGPTDPKEWKPIGEHVVAVRSASGDIRSVQVPAVFVAAKKLMAKMKMKTGRSARTRSRTLSTRKGILRRRKKRLKNV
jgi:ADP-heptose:LPS heptosyltransferase